MRLPAQPVDEEPPAGVQIADAEREDVQLLFHGDHSSAAARVGLEQNGRHYREQPPPGSERHLVRCRWEQRVGTTPHVQRVIPDNCADILVTADGRAVLVGPSTHVELPRLPAGTLIRGLRFHPYAVGTAFRLDATELTDRAIDLDTVLGVAEARAVAERIWTGDLANTWQRTEPDRATAGIVRALTSPGAPSVDAVADRAGYSPRHLRRVVRAETGLSPKTLSRVARLHDFLRAAEGGVTSLGRAAATAGYADQAHASREIRALAGLTPRDLLAERSLG
ncbi:helix-turn-helix domain-containing protein [Cryptosporangium sp. NPDC051539]|uniref:helix-turn-helix transcriptional regulator n=1 Tax=Cryptosporangium sp. NPDC051539 TaxID=3363962 RepID=UPI0037A3AA43